MNLMLIWVLIAVFFGALCNGFVGFLIAHAEGEPFIWSKYAATVIRAFASSVIATGTLSIAGTEITIPILILAYTTGYGLDAGLHDIATLTKPK